MDIHRFEIGKTYSTRSICDHDCIVSITVTGRTTKTVTGIDPFGKVKTFRPRIDDRGNEYVRPWGNYSMAPIVDATDIDASLDPPGYAYRVRELENEGLCTSDAQGVADAEFSKRGVSA